MCPVLQEIQVSLEGQLIINAANLSIDQARQSSANSRTVLLTLSGRSLMYIKNRSGPNTVPCGMHHGMTHVPWCMSGSLTCGGGENVPGIPSACTTRKFTYQARGPCEAASAGSIPVCNDRGDVDGLLSMRATFERRTQHGGFRRSQYSSNLIFRPILQQYPLQQSNNGFYSYDLFIYYIFIVFSGGQHGW